MRLLVPLDAGSDRLFNITNLIMDGNIFRPVTYPKLASLLSRGLMLTNLSLNRCKLGNEGLALTFDAIQMLKKLRKVEYANNNIFDAGIAKICPVFGKNQKSELSTIKFNTNEVTNEGLFAILKAIEKKDNAVSELSFTQNQISGEGSSFLCNWLKKQRTRNVQHNMNLVSCDLSMNKVMH